MCRITFTVEMVGFLLSPPYHRPECFMFKDADEVIYVLPSQNTDKRHRGGDGAQLSWLQSKRRE